MTNIIHKDFSTQIDFDLEDDVFLASNFNNYEIREYRSLKQAMAFLHIKSLKVLPSIRK